MCIKKIFRSVAFSLFLTVPSMLWGGIDVSGIIVEIVVTPEGMVEEPVEGVAVQFFGTSITDITDGSGEFDLQVPANSSGGFRATKTGYIPTYTGINFFGDYDDTGWNFPVVSEAFHANHVQAGTAPAHIPGKGKIVGMAQDENDEPVSDVEVQAWYLDTGTPAGEPRYFSDDLFLPDASLFTNLNGVFCFYNLEPGRPVLIRGVKAGTIFRFGIYNAYPDSITIGGLEKVGDTAVLSGFTLDDDDEPLEGVNAELIGTGITDISGADGSFTLAGIPIWSSCVAKFSSTGDIDVYQTGKIHGDMEGMEVFLTDEGILDDFEDIFGQPYTAGTGLVWIDTETAGVEIRLYDDEGVQVEGVSIYYYDEDGPNPALEATEFDEGCIIINLEPGYYFVTGHKEGLEFPVLWTPVFAGGVIDIWLEPNEVSHAEFAGGDGTEGSPYMVATAEHLNNVRHRMDAHFRQVADIDLGIAPYNEGMGWVPIGMVPDPWDYAQEEVFTGTYDGYGFIMRNLLIDREDDWENGGFGLFGIVGPGAVLKSIALEDVDITTGGFYTGPVAGLNEGTVHRCYATGHVTGWDHYVGGLVGANSGTVSESFSTCTVTGHVDYGGLAGHNRGTGTITDSYATGDVLNDGGWGLRGGGLVGWLDGGSIQRCYVTGWVEGVDGFDVDYLIGAVYEGTITDIYWNVNAYGLVDPVGEDGKTTVQMMQQDTFTGWDFDNIWGIDEGVSYPYLIFEMEDDRLPGDINGDGLVNIQDVILCLRIAVGLPVTIDGVEYAHPYTAALLEISDMNGDGVVNIQDVILLLRRAVGLD